MFPGLGRLLVCTFPGSLPGPLELCLLGLLSALRVLLCPQRMSPMSCTAISVSEMRFLLKTQESAHPAEASSILLVTREVSFLNGKESHVHSQRSCPGSQGLPAERRRGWPSSLPIRGVCQRQEYVPTQVLTAFHDPDMENSVSAGSACCLSSLLDF